MDFIQLAKSRRSTRSFKSDNVPKELLNQLIEAAQSAPSAGNCQPWHFYIIQDKTVIKRIREESCRQAFIETAPVLIVVCADIPKTEERYKKRGRELYCIQDTAAAIQNILLCAQSIGLGACWCGHFGEKEISEILNLHNEMQPVAIIPIGYTKNETEKRERRPIEEIATFIDRAEQHE
jgi:nitroreductase